MVSKQVTVNIEAILQQAEDETLRKIARFIAEDLKDLPGSPTTLAVDKFAEQEGFSVNFILEHRDEFCVQKIGGRVFVNMVAWREHLKNERED